MSQADIRIKNADSSEPGWNLNVSGVRILPTDDSSDEKCMYRTIANATRKMNHFPAKFQRRPRPYSIQPSTLILPPANQPITTPPSKKTGLCFLCGRSGHWRVDCPKQMVVSTDRNKIMQMIIYSYFYKAIECWSDSADLFVCSMAK